MTQAMQLPLLETEDRCRRCNSLCWLPCWIGVKCGACSFRPGEAKMMRDRRARRRQPEQAWKAHFGYLIRHLEQDVEEARQDRIVREALRDFEF